MKARSNTRGRTHRRFPLLGTVQMVRQVAVPPRKIDGGGEYLGGYIIEPAGTRQVRYAVETDQGHIAALVQKAAGNKNGRAKSGPITVYIHPDDRGGRTSGAS